MGWGRGAGAWEDDSGLVVGGRVLGREGVGAAGVALGRQVERQDHGDGEDADGHGEGPGDRDLVEVDDQHLDANEREHQGEAVAEQVEAFVCAGEQEVHGAQAEDGEDVGGQDDEGVGGDGEDRGDGVDREDDVDDADQGDDDGERGGHAYAVDQGEEFFAVVVRGDGDAAANPVEGRVVVEVGFLAGGPPHLDTGEEQEGAEEVEDPVEFGDEPGADQDHRGAQDECAEHADHEDALLEFGRDGEVGEEHQEDEDVVDRQGFFDQVAGDELDGLGVGEFAGDGVTAHAAEVPPQPADEDEGDGDPGQGPDAGLAHGDFVGALPVEGEEVEGEGDEDERAEERPHQWGANCHHDGLVR